MRVRLGAPLAAMGVEFVAVQLSAVYTVVNK
jgi:hypothetical protein